MTWTKFKTAELISRGVLEIGDGYRAKNSEMAEKGIPFVRAGDVVGRVNTDGTDLLGFESVGKAGRKRSMVGDVVMTTKGTIGRLAFVKEGDPEFIYSPQLCFWRSLDSELIHPRWLYFAMRSREMLNQISWSAGQTDMAPYVSLTDQRTAFEITLPAIHEQRDIAAILGALDDKIELNRKTAATLEEMARALYRSWFVDFDPVWAKVEGREPAHMDAETAALFPNRFGECGLPMGWEAGVVAVIADLNPEKHTKKRHPDAINYVDLSNTKWGLIDSTTNFSWVEAPSRARMLLRSGDTIVGTVRPGNGSYSFISVDGLTGSTGFAVLRPKHADDAELVYLAATAPEAIQALANLADGGAYPAVRPDVVAQQKLVVSPREIRKKFATAVSPIMSKIEASKHENQTLAILRDTLLPCLMSGELCVSAANKKIEALV